MAQNQAIFLFELGTTNLRSSAADFQDLVVLVTMKKAASTPLTAEQASRVLAAINLLAAADRELAECAINEAAFANGDADTLQVARQHYDEGVGQVASAKYKLASTAFGDAWKAAKAATGNREPDLAAALVQRIAPSPPGNWQPVQEAALRFNDSQVTHNGSGVAVLSPQVFESRNGQFNGNTNWGLTLCGEFVLRNCMIRDNSYGGLRMQQIADGQFDFSSLQIQDNCQYGVFLEDCHVSFDHADFAHWSISGSDHVVASTGSELTLDSVTIRGGRVAGVYAHGGTLVVRNSSLSENGYGIAAHQCDLTVDRSTLVRNTVGLYTSEVSLADGQRVHDR